MELYLRSVILSFLFIIFINFNGFSQCDPSQRFCRGECRPARDCAGNPPPPGLVVPIDSHITYLIISGLGLGIYFMVANLKKKAA